ncbi:MAG: alpha/beta fold hydrolase [Simplicispira suum]|uniref:alpha/beta hydrolase family protein n=1 Tax=Simplicispira suum TaxID=2109915 RepID=UPI001C6C4B9F|nr:alpha/beta fold hydrolase [Simplicispira suum]MBW7833280.1 alpha/beta fold hydrolase [Simplicispira suum]
MEKFDIASEDGRPLAANWVRASGARPALAAVVMHSATGVPRRYYGAFAQHLGDQGFDVLLWDARGIGDSARQPATDDPATMRDWGQRDQQAVLRYVRAEHPARRLFIVGHSSGGHLAGLAPLTASADALVLIASGGCDWRDYPVAQWPRLLGAWWLAMPLVLALWGHLPAWAGVGHALPRGVAQDWRRWSLTRGYLFSDPALDTRGYAAYAGPLLALSMSDDHGFAPPGAVRSLLRQFTGARIEHREIPAAGGFRGCIGHFGFFKTHNAALWSHVSQWLGARAMAG